MNTTRHALPTVSALLFTIGEHLENGGADGFRAVVTGTYTVAIRDGEGADVGTWFHADVAGLAEVAQEAADEANAA